MYRTSYLLAKLITATTLFFFAPEISAQDKNITRFEYGTDFGRCIGYCTNVMTISNKQIHFKAINRNAQTANAVFEKTQKLNKKDWQQLKLLTHQNAISQLPERIGCPDCADGGSEWVEIHFGPSNTKRILFENGHAPKALEKLVRSFRAMRKNFNPPER
jgi:hypothetical protein